jgi:hypothetical protein
MSSLQYQCSGCFARGDICRDVHSDHSLPQIAGLGERLLEEWMVLLLHKKLSTAQQCGPDYNNPACWAHHTTSGTPTQAPLQWCKAFIDSPTTAVWAIGPHFLPPPPIRSAHHGAQHPAPQIVECSRRLCQMSYNVCEVRALRQVVWRNPAAPLTSTADHVMRLVRALTALPTSVFPGEILDTTPDT